MSAATPTDELAPAPRSRTRRRLRRGLPVALLASVVLIGAVGCFASIEAVSLGLLANQEREARGLPPLNLDEALTTKAEGWAGQLAASGSLQHSSLWSGVPPWCTAVGENVAVGGDLGQIHAMWMGSSAHRANILNGSYNATGIGVARGGNGLYYAVAVYARC
jgi:uncharacterized protein YkwD